MDSPPQQQQCLHSHNSAAGDTTHDPSGAIWRPREPHVAQNARAGGPGAGLTPGPLPISLVRETCLGPADLSPELLSQGSLWHLTSSRLMSFLLVAMVLLSLLQRTGPERRTKLANQPALGWEGLQRGPAGSSMHTDTHTTMHTYMCIVYTQTRYIHVCVHMHVCMQCIYPSPTTPLLLSWSSLSPPCLTAHCPPPSDPVAPLLSKP